MSAGFETKSSDTKKRNRRQAQPAKVASIEAIQQSLVENFGDIIGCFRNKKSDSKNVDIKINQQYLRLLPRL